MAKYKFFQAGEKELDQLYELGKQFRQEFRKIFPQVDEDKAYKILDLLFTKGKIICCCIEGQDEIVGSIGFFKSQYWWAERYMYNVQWFYVKPEHRNILVFRNLLDGVKKIAKDGDIFLQIITEMKLDPLFKKFGFTEMGKNWIYKCVTL
jgi:hypothetical protein|tara:strand:- start:9 stop:458 length:450 start_codon:yes stop_codon:yes gene_type:complete